MRDVYHATGSSTEPKERGPDCAVFSVGESRLFRNVGKSLVNSNFFALSELDVERSDV